MFIRFNDQLINTQCLVTLTIEDAMPGACVWATVVAGNRCQSTAENFDTTAEAEMRLAELEALLFHHNI